VAGESSGITWSLARVDETAAEQFLRAFVSGYAIKALLRQVDIQETRVAGLAGRIRRWHERKRDSKYNKTRAMERLGDSLKPEAGNTFRRSDHVLASPSEKPLTAPRHPKFSTSPRLYE
jgi:hypothetical protein